ncbi:MAG: DNA-processing protein DprA, partial [Clostridia bacterium]|nr:DNA-processing protein DprA [Clostridia bacterium]
NLNELINIGAVKDHQELADLINRNKISEIRYAPDSKDTCKKLQDIINMNSQIREATENIISLASANNIYSVSTSDEEYYPISWKNLSGMPVVLFCIGQKDLLRQVNQNGAAAIVGSRYPSRYACDVTEEFTNQISDRNVVIVSGMALGIDRIAHKTALNNSKSTIGFVPGGCDIIYPYQNKDLYSTMYKDGLILSELPPGTGVIKQYFPSRNRLISAISDTCMIMEAGMSSGTLHTASFAANQGKSVFVLPNSIYCENAWGGLMLIKDGARILLNTDDVLKDIAEQVYYRLLSCPELLSEINSNPKSNLLAKKDIDRSKLPELYSKLTSPQALSVAEIKILIEDILSGKSKCIDDILKELPVGLSRLSSILAEMELNNELCSDGEKYSLT